MHAQTSVYTNMHTCPTYSTKLDLLIKKMNYKNIKTSRKLTSWVLLELNWEGLNGSSVEFSWPEEGEMMQETQEDYCLVLFIFTSQLYFYILGPSGLLGY